MTNYNDNINSTTREYEESKGSGGKITAILLGTAAIAAIAVAGLYLVDVDQTQEARLPEVSVDVAEGQMPKFDVDVADVNLESKEVEVSVPTVGVETETRTIEVEVPVDVDAGMSDTNVTVPTIDIDRPEEDNPADNTPSQ